MEILIYILIISIFINTILKISFWKIKFQVLFALFVAIFILYTYPIATEQSQIELSQWLEDGKVLSKIAILTTIEAFLYINFCFLSLKNAYSSLKGKMFLFLKIYAGLLVFPASFYVVTQSMFLFTGVDFLYIALGIALVVLVILPILGYGMRLLLPEEEVRLEVLLLVSIILTFLGLISTANGNIVYVPKEKSIDFQSILYIIGVFALLFCIGFAANRLKWKVLSRKYHFKK
ncbi:hypothetical protein [Capnocytophaga catalasegens]|uniref:Uncharacterized protein n=1 Tax=Capnocytophaga catalasegens TaxID=1004260 RepID=A0AAV5ASQ1_9FLAO|nr:hypothetical protein [Capnocytophaga catalasegens]GIZ16424.1 hypothetical protein RCZ03_24240 [Capnocytophaga catalasegens]GJM50337.1 hypothetical protein RCZ15_13100 [Capnocytophaga catalasegens]GJM53854.1 hypothetical protein RCZ16_21700 [Capnocytophaga catalasegens]